ncbi:hypothetical protein OF83DRAFT_1287250 [Amylostereum chailletii]|nr:hypothetical protein OF83DRAFT_1287250 [Amylostereum chailletii]
MNIRASSHFVFYQGWDSIHDNWEPVFLKASQWKPDLWLSVKVYYLHWRTIVLALGFFFLFGTTGEVREMYGRVFWTMTKALGIRLRERTTTGNLSTIVFEPRSEELSKDDGVTTSALSQSFTIASMGPGSTISHNLIPNSENGKLEYYLGKAAFDNESYHENGSSNSIETDGARDVVDYSTPGRNYAKEQCVLQTLRT